MLAQSSGKSSVEKSLLDQTLTKQITGAVDMWQVCTGALVSGTIVLIYDVEGCPLPLATLDKILDIYIR